MGNRPITLDELQELRRRDDVHPEGRLTLADVQRLAQEMCLRAQVTRPPTAAYLKQIFDKLEETSKLGTISFNDFEGVVLHLQKLRQDRRSRGSLTPAATPRGSIGGKPRTSTPPPQPQPEQQTASDGGSDGTSRAAPSRRTLQGPSPATSPSQRSMSPAQRAPSPVQRAASPVTRRAPSPVQRPPAPAQRLAAPVHRAPSPAQRGTSPAPRATSPAQRGSAVQTARSPQKASAEAPSPVRKSFADGPIGASSGRPSLATRRSKTPPPSSPQEASTKWSPDEHPTQVRRSACGPRSSPSGTHRGEPPLPAPRHSQRPTISEHGRDDSPEDEPRRPTRDASGKRSFAGSGRPQSRADHNDQSVQACKCGNILSEKSLFCNMCGTPVASQAAPVAAAPRGMADQCMEALEVDVVLDSPFTPSQQSTRSSKSGKSPRKSKSGHSPRSKSPRKKSPRDAAASDRDAVSRGSFGFFASLVGGSEGQVSASPRSPRTSAKGGSERKAARDRSPARDTEERSSILVEGATMLGETFSSMFGGDQAESSASTARESGKSGRPPEFSFAALLQPAAAADSSPRAAERRPSTGPRGRRSVLAAISQVEAELGPRRRPSIASTASAAHEGATASAAPSPEASPDADSPQGPSRSIGEGWHRPPPAAHETDSPEAPAHAAPKRRLRCADRARLSVTGQVDHSPVQHESHEDSVQAVDASAPAKKRHLRSTNRVVRDSEDASTSPGPARGRAAGHSSPVRSPVRTSDAATGDAEVDDFDSDESVSAKPSRPAARSSRPDVSRSSTAASMAAMAAPSAAPRRQSSLSPRHQSDQSPHRKSSTSPRQHEAQAWADDQQSPLHCTFGRYSPTQSAEHSEPPQRPKQRNEPPQRSHQRGEAAQRSHPSHSPREADWKEPSEKDGGSSDESITDFVVRNRPSKAGGRPSTAGRAVSSGADAPLASDLWAPPGRRSEREGGRRYQPVSPDAEIPPDLWAGIGGRRTDPSQGLDFQDWTAMGIGGGPTRSPRATSPISVRSRSSTGSSKKKNSGEQNSSQRSSSHRGSSHRREGGKQGRSKNFLDSDERDAQLDHTLSGWFSKGLGLM